MILTVGYKYTEQKWKMLHVNCFQCIYKRKQESKSTNDVHSSKMRSHFEHTPRPCFSHQKSVWRSPICHIGWISGMDSRKFDLFENQCWNMDKSSNFKPGIVTNAISIKEKLCLISSHWISIFVRKSIGTMCLNTLKVLHRKCFENLDTMKNFNSLKFSVIYLFPVMIHWCVRKPSRGLNNCMFWAMTEAEGEVGFP